MAIYEFICHDCEVIWEREAAMSKAPSRSRCPECKKLSNRHWGEVPVMFNGDGYYTNTRKQHHLVHNDRTKAKQVKEELLDIAKKQSENQVSPYKPVVLDETKIEQAHAEGKIRRKTLEEQDFERKQADEIRGSLYNNSAAYRKLGKR